MYNDFDLDYGIDKQTINLLIKFVYPKTKDNLEFWRVGFVSHHVDTFQVDFCNCILLYKEDIEKAIIVG